MTLLSKIQNTILDEEERLIMIRLIMFMKMIMMVYKMMNSKSTNIRQEKLRLAPTRSDESKILRIKNPIKMKSL